MNRFFEKIKKYKVAFGIVWLLLACLTVASVMAKYVQKDIPAGSFDLKISQNRQVFAVYGEILDADNNSLGNALNFYNRAMPNAGDTITLEGGTTQTVTEIYTGFDTTAYTANTRLPWYQKDIVSVTVADEGIAPVSTAYWFNIGKYAPDALGVSRQVIKSINDIGKLDTSNVTNMTEMFRNCSGLTSLDLSGLETENVTNMSSMFRNCQQLISLDLRGFDTATVRNMSYMFTSCAALKVLDLSTFNTTNVVYMERMFNCPLLETVYVSELWNTANVYSYSGIFASPNMIGGAGTRINEYNHKLYARIDGGTSAPGYFTYYKYSLVFEGNNNKASNVPALMLSPTHNTFTLPAAPAHPWATFLGWATSPDATTAEYQPGDTFTSSSSAPCCDVLYAVWDLGITNLTELNEEIANGVGETEENHLVIGGGDWSSLTITNKSLAIYDGNFASISRLDGSNVTIYGGQFNLYYMWMQGATVTIKDGSFTNANGFINPGDGVSTLIIEGGNFKWTQIANSSSGSEVIITGGTFGFNPSAYVPATHTVVDNGDGTWTVVDASE